MHSSSRLPGSEQIFLLPFHTVTRKELRKTTSACFWSWDFRHQGATNWSELTRENIKGINCSWDPDKSRVKDGGQEMEGNIKILWRWKIPLHNKELARDWEKEKKDSGAETVFQSPGSRVASRFFCQRDLRRQCEVKYYSNCFVWWSRSLKKNGTGPRVQRQAMVSVPWGWRRWDWKARSEGHAGRAEDGKRSARNNWNTKRLPRRRRKNRSMSISDGSTDWLLDPQS